MCEGVVRQALEKIISESPRVFAIVILPYSDKSNNNNNNNNSNNYDNTNNDNNNNNNNNNNLTILAYTTKT